MSKILIISSCIHKDLASEQLDKCLTLVNNSEHDHQVELLQAGVYEIPFVINTYQRNKPFRINPQNKPRSLRAYHVSYTILIHSVCS